MSGALMRARSVAARRRAARAAIDEAAGAARARYITDCVGQAQVYAAKKAEADALALDPQAPAPHLRAEAAALSATLASRASLVLAQWDQWNNVKSPAIEAARIKGHADVREVETFDDLLAVIRSVTDQMESI